MNEQILANDVAQMKKQVNDMYTALVGNEISKDGGLVNKMATMEQRLEKIDKKQTVLGVQFKILWTSAGAVLMGIYSLIIKK